MAKAKRIVRENKIITIACTPYEFRKKLEIISVNWRLRYGDERYALDRFKVLFFPTGRTRDEPDLVLRWNEFQLDQDTLKLVITYDKAPKHAEFVEWFMGQIERKNIDIQTTTKAPLDTTMQNTPPKRISPKQGSKNYEKWVSAWQEIKGLVDTGYYKNSEIVLELGRRERAKTYKGVPFQVDTIIKIIKAGQAGELEPAQILPKTS
jgi:hypothetical protein